MPSPDKTPEFIRIAPFQEGTASSWKVVVMQRPQLLPSWKMLFLPGRWKLVLQTMPKRKLEFIQGGYYHIYNRGAGRQSIFRQDENYLYLLRLLRQVLIECQLTMIAYCLLPNHYHWLVRQDGATLVSTLPKRVFGSYTQAFNRKYKRTGTLFEGPYEAIQVASDEYLHHLCRYIHANPVRHGLAVSPDLWPYSNYLEWIEQRPGTLVDRALVKHHFPRPDDYTAYVQSYLTGQVKLPAGLHSYLENLE
jgi:putative transposase